jgi:CRISPR-associated protein Cst2
MLIGSLAVLDGGAKQAVHYTDLTPAVIVLAVTKHGNNPFYRMLGSSQRKTTQFQSMAFRELTETYKDDLLSPIYIGWAHGFLDQERAKLEDAIKEIGAPATLGHPAAQIKAFAAELASEQRNGWYE